MQVTVRIPSKKVPYGYIELNGEPADFGLSGDGYGHADPTELAEFYAQFIKAYQAAEVAAFEAAPSKPKAKPVDSSVDEAAKMLSDGLGATEIDESEPVKPWDKSSDETESTTESKPWDTVSSDWDFS